MLSDSAALKDEVAVPPIPTFSRVHGPVTRFLLWRSLAVMAAIWLVSGVALLLPLPASIDAFALGLIAPGGGLLFAGHPWLAAAALLAFPVAIGIWWLCGIVVLPPAVWLASAVLAVYLMPEDGQTWDWTRWFVPLTVALTLIAGAGYQLLRFRLQSRRAAMYNRRLLDERPVLTVAPRDSGVREATPDDLKSLKYVLDLALQPIDRWDGFHFVKVDQFREGAVRYQLNFVSYTAAMYQFTCAPAFTGYAAEAQRNVIEKMLHRPVWSYWALENLWGNLKWNPDPVIDDNVMYSGYLGLMLGLYETTTGDQRYHTPGCLPMRWNEQREFRHDYQTITEALVDNFARARLGQYPCEPNWIYPMCNTFAINSLLVYDRLQGTDHAAPVIDGVRKGYENGDFCEPDGRLTAARSEYFGFRHPMIGNMGDAITALFMNPATPEIGRRTWWLIRTFHLGPEGRRGEFKSRLWNRLDPGNYGINDGFTRAALAANAREYGDEESAQALLESLRSRIVEARGARRYKGISAWGNLWLAVATFGGEDAFRRLVTVGLPESWRTGPVLSEAAYPDVLVARAVSDGHGLDLVLLPGSSDGCRTSLAVDRLKPLHEYRVTNALTDRFTADENGRAVIGIELRDRLEITVRPA